MMNNNQPAVPVHRRGRRGYRRYGVLIRIKGTAGVKVTPVTRWNPATTFFCNTGNEGCRYMGFLRICMANVHEVNGESFHVATNCPTCNHMCTVKVRRWCSGTMKLRTQQWTKIAQIEVSENLEPASGLNRIVFENKLRLNHDAVTCELQLSAGTWGNPERRNDLSGSIEGIDVFFQEHS